MDKTLLIPLIGVLVAAVIAAVTSLVVSILSKDQKTSEFRQSWIDAFREDAANLAGHWSTMVAMLDMKKSSKEDVLQFLASRHDDVINVEVRVTRMRLRLNPKEHAHLIGLLHHLGNGEMSGRKEMDETMEAIVVEVQRILRHEWKRVKRGELSFRLLKGLSFVAIIVGTCTSYYLVKQAA
ncbi:hypothetical protein EDF87_101546 [Pseudomonas helmanticensis]|uniref:Uncharacterized protein n=1 Tax=Pseudomonas helmanticensis TaxID=1471381 RepID=A0A4R7VV29_9PSED|nr:hypothetical protein [Pseudomonas helmanticensis]TDV53458.1 hypothetical protein EDF87_101546 [Pseudomonas helmanticensis]